jgi:hypothetical protein
MVTALPALLIPLAHTMDRALSQSILLTFVLAFGLCVGWDSNYEALVQPEGAYDGLHLVYRALDQVYPVGIHFPLLEGFANVPWSDAGLWAVGVAILALVGRIANRKLALLLVGSVVILPAIAWSDLPHRLDTQVAPALRRFTSQDVTVHAPTVRATVNFGTYNGAVREENDYVARPSSAHSGIVGYSGLPGLYPSVYRSTVLGNASLSSDGSPGAYYVLARRFGVRAQLNHQTRYAVPVTDSESAASVRIVETSARGILQHFVVYNEGVHLRFGDAELIQRPTQLIETLQLETVRSLNLDTRGGRGFYHGFIFSDLEPGSYRFGVQLEEVDMSVWIDRKTDPIMITVFEDVAGLEDGKEKATRWRPMLGRAIELPPLATGERPAVEAYVSPFWAKVPFADQMKFNFENARKQTFYVEIFYSGQHGLVLKSIDLHRRSFTQRIDGSPLAGGI